MPVARMLNWNEARAAYVTSDTLTYRELAKQYGVTLAAVAKVAGPENWPEQRLARQEQVANALIAANAEKRRKEGPARTDAHLLGFRSFQTQILRRIEGDAGKALSAQNLALLARSYGDAVRGERLVLGETTERSEQSVSGSLTVTDDSDRTPEELAEWHRSEIRRLERMAEERAGE